MKQINYLFTTIKNSFLSNNYFIYINASIFKYKILKLLQLKGYIKNWYWINLKFKNLLFINLNSNLKSIHGFKYFNPKLQKNYIKKKNLKNLKQLTGLVILSTSKGILSVDNAYKLGLGGSLICYIW
uniref:30S ribosomal protein S8 n=1 Tax=Nephromyces sp. ex Molgula occidentalis TaxID=2544991 RepID=A0A5C1H8V8_9APIC|nr:30S ribosomal protein S8 [Nephromyces sp. ex Molgula occidentalis]